MIKKFCDRIINGSSGFKTFESREFPIYKDRDVAIVEFTIRCLANKNCENSKEVLVEINKQQEL